MDTSRRWLIGCVAIGALASVLLAKPGIVKTHDGQTFQGDVTEDAKFYTITSHGIPTKIDKRNADVSYVASVDDQFADKLKQLAATDVPGRIDLANWALQNERPDLAVNVLQEAVAIDPANRQAALLLDTAHRQIELSQTTAAKHAGNSPKPAEAAAPASQSAPAPETTSNSKSKGLEHRLLTIDEVNIIRQQEMSSNDTGLRIQFKNDVIKRYLASGDRDVAKFQKESAQQQAQEILQSGEAKMANDVRIVNDPAPLMEFKQKVYPVINAGCASAHCHGGTNAGNFGLYSGDSPNVLYTNFYILQSYTKTINHIQYSMLDRTLPDRSLFLQFNLPSGLADVSHPETADFRPRFRTKNDSAYRVVLDWLTNGLKPIAPDYGIKVSPQLPSTQPADGGK